MPDAGEDLLVGERLAGRLGRLVLPLGPARRVGERAVLLGEDRRREQEDLGLRRLLGDLPELGGLGLERLGDDAPVELRERRDHLLGVRPARDGIHAEVEEALDLPAYMRSNM
jgi:hypothetical protein